MPNDSQGPTQLMTASSSALSQMFAEDAILETIVSNLDSYGVISLLKAFPKLQKKAVLITDHEMPPMFFGELNGVQRRLLQFPDVTVDVIGASYGTGTGIFRKQRTGQMPVYCKERGDSQPIKLIETALCSSWCRLASIEPGMDHLRADQIVDLNGESFLFIALPFSASRRFSQDVITCGELETRLDKFTDAKWHSGLPTYFPLYAELIQGVAGENVDELYDSKDSRDLPGVLRNLKNWFGLTPGAIASSPKNSKAPALNSYTDLRTLRIDSVTTLPDSVCLPMVENLSVDFSCPVNFNDRPIIKALFAPALRVFVVHFSLVLPLFVDCNYIGTSQRVSHYGRDGKAAEFEPMLFELADRNRLDHSRFNNHTASKFTQRVHCEPLELPFLLNFSGLILGGVPLSLLRSQDLASIITAQFHFTDSPYYIPEEIPVDWTVHMSRLLQLRCHVTSSGIILPKLTKDPVKTITCPYRPQWRQLPDEHLIAFTTLVDDLPTFPRFWKHLAVGPNKCLFSLVVYSSPRLLKRKEFNPDKLIQISREDWFSVFRYPATSRCYRAMLSPPQFVGDIHLTGFVMDFLEGPTDVPLYATQVEIQPLITSTSKTITCDIFTSSGNLCFPSPFSLESNGSGVNEWKLDLRIQVVASNLRQFPYPAILFFLSLGTKFTSCSLNGKPVSFEPSQDWKDALYQSKKLRYHPRTRVLCHHWKIPHTAVYNREDLQPVPTKDFSTDFFPTAEEFIAHVARPQYSPFLKFANRAEPVTLQRKRRPPDWTFMTAEDRSNRLECE